MGKSLAPDYGLSGIPETPNTAGIPPINISGLQRLGSSPWRPQSQLSKVQQILDSLSWLRGNHSLKFGYEFRRQGVDFVDLRSPQGEITAAGIYTTNGFGVPDFLLGNVSNMRFTTPTTVDDYQIGNSFYVAGQLASEAEPDHQLWRAV